MLYRDKEAGLGFAAKATKNPLPFDFATSVILRLAKLGLVNLRSCSRSAYWPRLLIDNSVGTNLKAIVTVSVDVFSSSSEVSCTA